jgi:SAM-dependent methyltransferase
VSAIVWHDLECGRYETDLPLWRELAAAHAGAGGPVLDVGAGTGRVTLALARAGHALVALDRDPELLAELSRRAAGLTVETACADARDFELGGRSFPLIVVPMQTVQLLDGPDGRAAFLQRARAHLAGGGVLAVAIAAAEHFEEFEWEEGDASPLPDIAEVDGCAYFSQPTAVRREGDTFVLERRREIVDAAGRRTRSDDRIGLDVLSPEGLQAEAIAAGLRPLGVRRVSATEEHIGSEVVILGA